MLKIIPKIIKLSTFTALMLISSNTYSALIDDIILGKTPFNNFDPFLEESTLEGILGKEVDFDFKIDAPDFDLFQGDLSTQWLINLSSFEPRYFVLKFSFENSSLDTLYFFENTDVPSELVWNNTQVDGLVAGDSCGASGSSCSFEGLSQLTAFNPASITVPEPSSLGLMIVGLLVCVGSYLKKNILA